MVAHGYCITCGINTINNKTMIKNYLKIAWRNLVKNRIASLINVGGLAVGMAVAMLIGLWVWDEFSFDKQYKNIDRIARVDENTSINGRIETWNASAWPLAPTLRSNFGNYFKHIIITSWTNKHLLTYNNNTAEGQRA
jgi:putative ABC transport system permease protein